MIAADVALHAVVPGAIGGCARGGVVVAAVAHRELHRIAALDGLDGFAIRQGDGAMHKAVGELHLGAAVAPGVLPHGVGREQLGRILQRHRQAAHRKKGIRAGHLLRRAIFDPLRPIRVGVGLAAAAGERPTHAHIALWGLQKAGG